MGLSLQRCPDALIERVYASRELPLEDGGKTPLNVYVPREQGDYLYSLVRAHRPKVTIEIGLANGLSALFICAAHRDNDEGGRHIAIDPFQASDWRNVGTGLLKIAGMGDRLRLVELPSHQGLPDLEREGVTAGLIFIDGSHLTDYVFADFVGSDRILELGGLMVFDDSDWAAIQPVIRYAISNRGYVPAYPDVVIEPPPGRPTLPAKMLRAMGRKSAWLGRQLRPEFMHPDQDLGIMGRCVALRKQSADERDSQNQSAHRDF